MNKGQAQGFSTIEILVTILVLVAAGFGGWYVWHKNKNGVPVKATMSQGTQNKQPTTPADPYAGWKTYADKGTGSASGVSIKYPSDWEVATGGNAFAWEVQHATSPEASINVRFVFLDASKTAQQEWDDCANPDACGPAPGETKIESTTSTTNGLDTYAVKMQGSTGVYYATVIKGTKATGSGVPFVEFLLNKPDASTLDTYKQIVGTATFPN